MLIAITGSIASGKSSVARQLAKVCCAEHIDTDEICRELLLKDHPGYNGVVLRWGRRFLLEDNTIDRSLLRQTIFDDHQVRSDLEGILHPLAREIVKQLQDKYCQNKTMVIVEVPLLFETNWQDDFDKVITVYADPVDSLQRVLKRDGVSLDQAEKILKSQIPVDEKMKLSDYVIDNSGMWEQTCRHIYQLAIQLQKLSSTK